MAAFRFASLPTAREVHFAYWHVLSTDCLANPSIHPSTRTISFWLQLEPHGSSVGRLGPPRKIFAKRTVMIIVITSLDQKTHSNPTPVSAQEAKNTDLRFRSACERKRRGRKTKDLHIDSVDPILAIGSHQEHQRTHNSVSTKTSHCEIHCQLPNCPQTKGHRSLSERSI